jgi:phage shock protein PspC (stress-responsive transcriptional regulator)
MATTKSTTRAIEKPSNLTALGVLNIVSGVINIVAGLSVTFGFAISLVGLICVPITILPAVLGVFEILYGIKLLASPPQPVKPSQAIAICQLITFLYLNVVSGVVGILALVFYNDPQVKEYFVTVNS